MTEARRPRRRARSAHAGDLRPTQQVASADGRGWWERWDTTRMTRALADGDFSLFRTTAASVYCWRGRPTIARRAWSGRRAPQVPAQWRAERRCRHPESHEWLAGRSPPSGWKRRNLQIGPCFPRSRLNSTCHPIHAKHVGESSRSSIAASAVKTTASSTNRRCLLTTLKRASWPTWCCQRSEAT